MIFKSLSVALASVSLANANSRSYYTSTSFNSELSGKNEVGLKVFNGRGYYDIVNLESNAPNLHRATTTSDPVTTTLVLDEQPSSDFATAVSVDYISDFQVPMKAPPTVFAGWFSDNNEGIVTVHQGVKRTSLAQWSEVQTLRPPPQFDAESYFGNSISVDQATHRKLAVGCYGCNSTTNGGQVYLYSPTSPAATSWSQSQVLELSEAAVAAGYKYLGWNVQLHDNVLLAATDGQSQNHYAVFARGPKPEDRFELQQVVNIPGVYASSAAVYEETIVLADSGANIGSVSSAGKVYILYPSTPEFHLKPASKPRPVQWSVQQVLQLESPQTNDRFGYYVSLDRNTLVVAANGDDNAYVYRREEQSGKWSQQQVLANEEVEYTSVAGSKVTIGGDEDDLEFFNLEEMWSCLVISLEDQFGDGWDIAELVVNAPDGTQDYFAQSCEMENPRQIRYCPNLASDGGLYSFSIPGALKAKYHWELQWGIFDEETATWYRGQWDTKMDFHWDPETLSFSPRKMDRVLPTNTTCTPCKTRPTEKPTPVLRRLKGSSGTQSPTISPAPTLDVSSNLNWRYLNLAVTDGNPWFDDRYQGTNYYVSDAHGHKLITSGTLCEGEASKQCWVDVPDGDYVLRVSGALSTHKSGQTFSYCKGVAAKSTQHQLAFRVADDDCRIITAASQQAVCQSLGITLTITSLYLVLNVNMILSGTTASTITNAEATVFGSAMASIIPGLTASDVHIVSVTPSGSSTYLNANIHLSSALGYNLLDVDGEAALEAYVKEVFSSHSKEVNFAAALGAGSVASTFSHITRVEFVDYRIVESREVMDHSTVDTVTSFADESLSSSLPAEDSSEPSAVFEGAMVGYVLAGVGILFVVGFFVGMSSSARVAENSDIDSSSQVPSKTRMSLSGTALSLTPTDLQELAKMEQEYLKIIEK